MPTKAPKPDYPVEFFADAVAFEKWLAKNHAKAPGVWLRFAKKGSGITSLDYKGALDVALCYGWIDSQSKSIDATWYQQKFTPRGPKSIWSKVNREKIAALEAVGRVKPSGIAEVERAKADGRWDAAYDSPRNATVPDDLQTALDASPRARDFFATLNGANRYAVLWRIQTAKRAETRAKRIAELVAMLERGEKIHD
jgi:uncharacterized protein YdeI (YjbR/CyaY-like superfamily)